METPSYTNPGVIYTDSSLDIEAEFCKLQGNSDCHILGPNTYNWTTEESTSLILDTSTGLNVGRVVTSPTEDRKRHRSAFYLLQDPKDS